MNAFKAMLIYSDTREAAGGNKALDGEPYNSDYYPSSYWEASRIKFNLGVKLINDSCHQTFDSHACNAWLSNTLNRCPTARLDWKRVNGLDGRAMLAAMKFHWQKALPLDTW